MDGAKYISALLELLLEPARTGDVIHSVGLPPMGVVGDVIIIALLLEAVLFIDGVSGEGSYVTGGGAGGWESAEVGVEVEEGGVV